MNDIPTSIASPYLTEAQLSFDPDEGPSELAEFLLARQPSVLLNHGDAEAFGETVSRSVTSLPTTVALGSSYTPTVRYSPRITAGSSSSLPSFAV